MIKKSILNIISFIHMLLNKILIYFIYYNKKDKINCFFSSNKTGSVEDLSKDVFDTDILLQIEKKNW